MAGAFAYTVDDLVIGQDGAEGLAPVDLAIAAIGQAVIHQYFLLTAPVGCRPFGGSEDNSGIAGAGVMFVPVHFKKTYQPLDGHRLILLPVVPAVEKLEKDPLGPLT